MREEELYQYKRIRNEQRSSELCDLIPLLRITKHEVKNISLVYVTSLSRWRRAAHLMAQEH